MTLVVPLRDEEHTVGELICSIDQQTRAPDAVIFVDAGSQDLTWDIVTEACRGHPAWSVAMAGPATPGRARNVGIEAAVTEWVALADAGTALDPHWLERLVRAAASGAGIEVVWGHYEPAPDGWFTDCAALAYVSPPDKGAVGPVRSAFIASCLLRRSVWERAGRFPDLRAAEDQLFIRRVRELEIVAVEAPEAVVWWHLQSGFKQTFQRFRLYSRVNASADQQRYWHHGVARMYLISLPFVAMAVLRRRAWALIPLLGGAYRVQKAIWRRREGRGVLWAANPARVATVAGILGTVDAATFWGWLEWGLQTRWRTTPPAPLAGRDRRRGAGTGAYRSGG